MFRETAILLCVLTTAIMIHLLKVGTQTVLNVDIKG